MKYQMMFAILALAISANAIAGEMIEIVKTSETPLCHILAHQAAPRALERTIIEAEEQSNVQCGPSTSFNSDSVSITTTGDGCRTLFVEVKGRCYRN